VPDLTSPRLRRDVVLLTVGALFGLAVGSLVGMALDDDEQPATTASGEDPSGASAAADPGPTIDPTDTEFGQLTEEGRPGGVKIQWIAEITEGAKTGTVEFVAAHKEGTTVVVAGDTRVIDDGTTIRVCTGRCEKVDAAKARSALPELVRPFWDIIRSVEETTAAPTYRVTGETQLASGIFQRCGEFDPKAFGLAMPANVVKANQCLDAQRNVPLTIGLQGEQRTVGGASFQAIADAEADLFKT